MKASAGVDQSINPEFESIIRYAWYIFIEDQSDDVREEAKRCLQVLIIAARLCFLDKKPIEEMKPADFSLIKGVLLEHLSERSSTAKAITYLRKYLVIISENQLANLRWANVTMLL